MNESNDFMSVYTLLDDFGVTFDADCLYHETFFDCSEVLISPNDTLHFSLSLSFRVAANGSHSSTFPANYRSA